MDSIILASTSALIANRQKRINSEIDIANYAGTLCDAKEKLNWSPLNIMVDSKGKVHNNWRWKYRVCSASLPKNSIYKISENIMCVCPELMLIQLSSILSWEQLALISMEMCGSYSFDVKTNEFIKNLKPQTSLSKIKTYVHNFEKLNQRYPNIKSVHKVLQTTNNGSASPMESRLYIRLCGERKDGFYGCTGLELNKPIQLSNKASKIAGQKVVVVDILCKKSKVAIEYNSAQYHENSIQGQKDSRRRDALVLDGWKVISITPEQFYDEDTFHVIAIQILKSLGQNSRIRSKNFERKKHEAFFLLKESKF